MRFVGFAGLIASIVLGFKAWSQTDCADCDGLIKDISFVQAAVGEYSRSAEYFAGIVTDFQAEDGRVKLKLDTNEASSIDALLGPDYKPSESAGIFLLFRLPQDFRLDHRAKDSLSVDFSEANTLIHPQQLGKDGKVSTYEADGVGQTLVIKKTRAVDNETEVGVSLRLLHLTGGGSLVAKPVSDRFIESVHRRLGYSDPFKSRGENLLVMDMRDFSGNRLAVKESRDFVLPIVIDLNKMKTLMESKTSRTTIKGGLHLGIPVDKNFGQLSFGADCVLVHTRQITQIYLVSLAGGVALQAQRNIYGGYQPTPGTDVSHHEMVAFAVSRMDRDGQGKTSLVTSVQQNSAFIDSSYRGPMESRRWVDRQAADAMTMPDRRLEVAVVRETKNWTIRGGVTEDFVGRRGYRANGLNHEDFKVFISATRKF